MSDSKQYPGRDMEISSEIGRVAPAWVPDSASRSCLECRTRFSFVKRKHHCRACGRLLCDSCTPHHHPLEYLGWGSARVCRDCLGTIKKIKSNESHRSRSVNDFEELKTKIGLLVESKQTASVMVEEDMMEKNMVENEMIEDVGECYIDLLPPEVLARVLGYLCWEDQLECRCVCRAWLMAVEVTDFYKNSTVAIGEGKERRQDTVSLFSRSPWPHQSFLVTSLQSWRVSSLSLLGDSPHLRHLHLVDCEVDERQLVTILEKLVNLKSLGLVNCRGLFMTGTFLAGLPSDALTSLTGLESLCLDHNSYLSDLQLLRMIGVAPNITNLSLAGCNIMNHSGIYTSHSNSADGVQASPTVLTWKTVAKVVRDLGHRLKQLILAGNTGIQIEDLNAIPDLDLDTIDLSGCSSVSSETFLIFAKKNRNLRNLAMANSRRIFSCLSPLTREIMDNMPSLQEVNLSENSIPHFQHMAQVTGLQKLVMNSLDTPGKVLLDTLLSLDTSSLKVWQARFLSLTSPDLVTFLTKTSLTSLSHLDLSYSCEGVVTDQVVHTICSTLGPTLVHLDLTGNASVSDLGLLGLQDCQDQLGTSLREMVDSKILLGSKEEQQIKLEAQRTKLAVHVATLGHLTPGLSRLPRLKHLGLGGTSVTSVTLSVGLGCEDLRHLGLGGCRGKLVSDLGIVETAKRCKRLSSLVIRDSCVTDEGLLSTLSCLPRLKMLDVRECVQITTTGLVRLSQVAPQLQTLLLTQCPGVSHDTGRLLMSSMPSLKKVDLLGQKEQFSMPMVGVAPPPQGPPQGAQGRGVWRWGQGA